VALWAASPALGAVGLVATIREGDALLVRGAGRAPLVEGARLRPDDLLRTGPGGFVRIESDDGDVIDLGPATSIRLGARDAVATKSTYLLSGWAKFTAGRGGSPAFVLATARLAVGALQGSVVVRCDASSSSAFLERGSAQVEERRGARGGVQAMREGGFAEVRESSPLTLEVHPPSAFMREVPAAFRDPIPSRFARFSALEGPSMAPVALRLEDVEPWLASEPSVRDPLVRSWRSSVTDPAVRAALARGPGASPEAPSSRKGER